MLSISPYKLLGLNTYQQYIAHTVARYILLIAFALVSLFFIFDILSESSEIGNGKYSLRLVILFSALKMPAQLYDVMPIAVVAGGVVGLATLANSSEITVLRASSMTPKQLLRILFLTGIPFVLLTVFIGEWLQPFASVQADNLRAKALGYRVNSHLKTGLWLRDILPNGEIRFLNIPNIDGDGNIPQMWLYHFDTAMHLIQRSQALKGVFLTKESDIENTKKILSTSNLNMPNLNISNFISSNKQSFWLFNSINTEYYHPQTAQQLSFNKQLSWRWYTNLNTQSLVGLQKNPDRVGVADLLNTVLFQMNNDLDSRKSLSILLRRTIYPLALWVMLMISFPFAYLRARDGAIAARIFAGVLLGMSFHAGNRLFEFMSLAQGWPVWLTVQLPLWLGVMTALILFWRFHRLH
jgi:lipopolysaccharide export system permease protein